jgi:hypothetical protein
MLRIEWRSIGGVGWELSHQPAFNFPYAYFDNMFKICKCLFECKIPNDPTAHWYYLLEE